MARYTGLNVTPAQAPIGQGGQAVVRQARQNIDTVTDRLESFSRQAFQLAGAEAQEDAIRQAALDDANGAEFHRESIHTVYGKAYNNARSASYAANAEMNLNEQSLQYAQDYRNDPMGYQKAMTEYYRQLQADAPTPELGGVIAITGRKVTNHTFGKLSIEKDNNLRNQRVVEYETYLDQTTSQMINQASTGKLRDVELARQNMEVYTQTMINEGDITEAQAMQKKASLEFQFKKGTTERKLEDLLQAGKLEEAKGMIESFNQEIPSDLTPKQYDSIQSSLNSTYGKHLKNIQAENNVILKAQKKALKTGADAYEKGFAPENEEQLNDLLDVMNEEDTLNFRVSQAAYQTISRFEDMSLPEQQMEINKMEASETASPFQLKVLDKARASINEKMRLVKNDPMSLSIQEGNANPTYTLQVGMRQEDLYAGLLERSAFQATNIEKYGENATSLLTDTEASQFSAWLESVDTSVEDKLGFITAVETSAPEQAQDVYNQLSKKGASVFAYAGSLVKDGESEKAGKLLRGQQVLKEVPKIVDYTMLNWKLSGKLGNALQFAGPGQREAIYKSAAAYYAATAEEKGKLDGSLSMADINDVISELTNGVGTKNEQSYFLPKGKSEGDVDDFIDELDSDNLPDFSGVTKEQGLKIIQDGQLISVGDGQYQVRFKRAILKTITGKPYILEIK